VLVRKQKKHCRMVMGKNGKMYCKAHDQWLIYVYDIPDRNCVGYRCQVGEDLGSKIQEEYIEE